MCHHKTSINTLTLNTKARKEKKEESHSDVPSLYTVHILAFVCVCVLCVTPCIHLLYSIDTIQILKNNYLDNETWLDEDKDTKCNPNLDITYNLQYILYILT